MHTRQICRTYRSRVQYHVSEENSGQLQRRATKSSQVRHYFLIQGEMRPTSLCLFD